MTGRYVYLYAHVHIKPITIAPDDLEGYVCMRMYTYMIHTHTHTLSLSLSLSLTYIHAYIHTYANIQRIHHIHIYL